MTALNLIAQPDAAYMIADASGTDSQGRLTGIEAKGVEFPRMCIAWSGILPNNILADAEAFLRGRVEPVASRGTDAIMAALSEACRDVHQLNRRSLTGARCEADFAFGYYVALWDDGPQLWAVSSEEADFGREPYSPVRVGYWIGVDGAGVDPASLLGRSVDFSDPASFDVELDGRALLEAQRKISRGIGSGEYCRVGGFGDLVRVGPGRVTRRRLVTWPDRVGRRIEPCRRRRLPVPLFATRKAVHG